MLNNRGASIIEMLIVMFVGLIIIGTVYDFNTSQGRAFSRHQDLVYSQESARLIMTRLSQDIRRAGLKTSVENLCGIATADDKTIRILSDLDLNGNTMSPGEDITYQYDPLAQTISRNGTNGTTIKYNGISSFSFSYTLVDGTVTSAPSTLTLIRRVTIYLQVMGRNNKIDLYSDITPRNLGL